MKVALITGARSGIGRAIAIQFLKAGYNICVTGRDLKALRAAYANEYQPAVHCVQADCSQPAGAVAAVQATLERFGRLDVLVNNAGGAALGKTVAAADESAWQSAMDLNFFSVVDATRAAIPALKAARGCVVNFSSVLATRPVPGLAPYIAAKAAVEAFTKAAALELAPAGVRVVCIAPATVRTEFHTSAGMSPETAAAYYEASAATHPLGRVGVPEDIAHTVVFLADSERAGWLTGAILPVDGGRSLTSAVAAQLRSTE